MKNLFIRTGALMMAALFVFLAVFTVAPVQVSAAEEYTVSGVWTFNDVLDIESVKNLSFPGFTFTVKGNIFYGVTFNNTTYRGYSNSDLTQVAHFYNPNVGGWLDPEYQTADFGKSKQAVSEEFYTWLNANATFQAPPPDQGPLVEATAKVDLTAVLLPILTIIPIGLVCLVGYKGLRKALDLFRRILLGA